MVIRNFDADLDEWSRALNEEQRLYSVHTNIVPLILVPAFMNEDFEWERKREIMARVSQT